MLNRCLGGEVMYSDFFIGLDLGQTQDNTALAILERTEKTFEIVYPDKPARIEKKWNFGCRDLKRWPLGTSYPAIVDDVAELVKKPPLGNAHLVIDGTGVGRPVTDMFAKARLPVRLA